MHEEKLIHLLKKKRGFFETILDLTENESDLSVNEWISILEQKKILLSCVDEVDEELRPFQAKLHMISQDVTDELDGIRSTIRQILHLDTQNQRKRKKELNFDEGRAD